MEEYHYYMNINSDEYNIQVDLSSISFSRDDPFSVIVTEFKDGEVTCSSPWTVENLQ